MVMYILLSRKIQFCFCRFLDGSERIAICDGTSYTDPFIAELFEIFFFFFYCFFPNVLLLNYSISAVVELTNHPN